MVAQVMLNVASGQAAAERQAQRELFESVVLNINRQFEQIRNQPEILRPAPLNIGMKYIFRSRPGNHFRIQVTLDLPDDLWLSPADPFGKLKLDKYKKRTERPIPGLPISWGKLNRIAAEIVGNRTIVFTSIPLTRECWYGTDDDYVAALLREHMRMATTPGYPNSDFRDVYEVSQGRKYVVDGFEFDDNEVGHAQMIAYIQSSGGGKTIEVVTEGDDSPLLAEFDPAMEFIMQDPEDSARAIARYQDEQERIRMERTAAFQASEIARQAAVVATGIPDYDKMSPTEKRKATMAANAARKAAEQAAQDAPQGLIDPLDGFEAIMDTKEETHPAHMSVGEIPWQEPDFPDGEGSISDLVDEVTDNGLDESAAASDGSDSADGLSEAGSN